MEYQLCVIDANGDAHVMLTGEVHPLRFPFFALKVVELAQYIPGLSILTLGHQLTELRFERGNVKLRGEPVVKYDGVDD